MDAGIDVSVDKLLKDFLLCASIPSNPVDSDGRKLPKRIVDTIGFYRRWVQRIHRYGKTKRIFDDLNKALGRLTVSATMEFDPKTSEVSWRIGNITRGAKFERSDLVAFFVAILLESGALDSLKRCVAHGCPNFHVRRGIWCSDNCGSRERQRDKRKRDKLRQML